MCKNQPFLHIKYGGGNDIDKVGCNVFMFSFELNEFFFSGFVLVGSFERGTKDLSRSVQQNLLGLGLPVMSCIYQESHVLQAGIE